jgi:hypothetical protein
LLVVECRSSEEKNIFVKLRNASGVTQTIFVPQSIEVVACDIGVMLGDGSDGD